MIEYSKLTLIGKVSWIAGMKWEEVDMHGNSNSTRITSDALLKRDSTLHEKIDFLKKIR